MRGKDVRESGLLRTRATLKITRISAVQKDHSDLQ